MNYINTILRQNRLSLLTIYIYLTVCQVLLLVSPYVLGKAIDGLISQQWTWLIVFFVIEILANIFMYKRMAYDTIVYTKIYNDVVLNYLDDDKNSNLSTKNARTEMANLIIHFFEEAIPYYIMSVISIFGSAAFILWTDWMTGIVVIGCVIPIVLIVRYFYPKINTVIKLSNTHYEKRIAMMEQNDQYTNRQFFERRGKLQIQRSTLQGKHWFALNGVKTLFLVFALVIFTHKEIGLTQGEAIAMYSYINQFLISLMSIPVAIEIWSMVKDVTHRLNTDNC